MTKPSRLPALLLLFFCHFAAANNACQSPVISAVADVSVSDGPSYQVSTYYRSAEEAVVTFLGEGGSEIVSEGPHAWFRQGEKSGLAGDREKRFAIGHQYHAMLLYFDTMMANVAREEAIGFSGGIHGARTGAYPSGGAISLVDGSEPRRPLGLLMLLPEETPIEVLFDDWRIQGEQFLPHKLEIHHGERIFGYRYSSLEMSSGDALDFQDRYASPALDQVDVYRLHRALLAAHCRGDAALIRELSLPQTLMAAGGELVRPTGEELLQQFEELFKRLDYTAYYDLKSPVIHISEGGDTAWIGVEVRAVARTRNQNIQLDSQWAWIMMATSQDGVWRHAGNASNRRLLE